MTTQIVPQQQAQPPQTDKKEKRFYVSGTAINHGVTRFTDWLDEFLIRSAGLMIMAGMIAGTLDVFTTVGLIKLPWFTLLWAGVQSIAIDGLFFAVWRRIRRLWATVSNRWSLLPLIGVGVVLALVASLISATLSYQQLNNASDVATAMATLGIDKTLFSYVRSFLVVIVAILIVLVIDDPDQNHQATHTQAMQATQPVSQASRQPVAQNRSPRMVPSIAQVSPAASPNRSPQAIGTVATQSPGQSPQRSPKGETVALPQQAGSIDHSLDSLTQSPASVARSQGQSPKDEDTGSPQETGYIAIDDGSTVAIANGHGATMIATGSHRDRIKQAMLVAMHRKEEVTYNEIAKAAGVGYSTVKKHAPAIKMELATHASPEEQPQQSEV